ncbi:MAG: DUF4230 domain-containing protein [Luteolibacter sp.]|uniref:DUF4230 domain-containing protein n=1 Tax=Luteolibacter sp. TaxID=1962973 RepID=UPI003267F710
MRAMEHRVEMWRTLRRTVTLIAIIGGIWLLVVHPIEHALSSTKRSVEHGLEQVLGAITNRDTRIVEGRAEIVETSEISELALLEMRMSATRTIEKSESFSGLPLGTKKLIVRGHYQVKGGYRLKSGISLSMENGKPVARFPKPEILSVELIDFDVLSEDDGWLNRIQPEDRAQILRELRSQMRLEAEQSGMLTTVEATLRTRLRDLLGVENVSVEQKIP